MQAPLEIETTRLWLRKPRQEYAEAIFRNYAQDIEVTRFLTWRPHQNLDDTHAAIDFLLAGWQSGREFSWNIFSKDDNELIGAISARNDETSYILGYVLARSSWNLGFMTEAVNAVAEWAFAEPNVTRVWAVCDVENVASARVLEKASFQREGLLEKWCVHPNISSISRDCFSYGKTRQG